MLNHVVTSSILFVSQVVFVGSLFVSLLCLIPELVELFVSPCATSCASEALRFIASGADDVDSYGFLWILNDSYLLPIC